MHFSERNLLNDNFIKQHTDELIARYPSLASVRDNFIEGYKVMLSTYEHKGKLLVKASKERLRNLRLTATVVNLSRG